MEIDSNASEAVFQQFKHVKPRLNRAAIDLICSAYEIAKEKPATHQPVESCVDQGAPDEGELEFDLMEYLEGYEKLSPSTCRAWAKQIMGSVIRPYLDRHLKRESDRPDDCFDKWIHSEGYGSIGKESSVYHNRKAGWDAAMATKRESIDRWKLAKWLYDLEAEVDTDGVQLCEWESREQKVRDAYYTVAGDCLEATCNDQRQP